MNCAILDLTPCAASTTSVDAVSTPKGMHFWSPDYCEAGASAYVRTPRGGYVMNDCQVDVFEPFKHEDHRTCGADILGELSVLIGLGGPGRIYR